MFAFIESIFSQYVNDNSECLVILILILIGYKTVISFLVCVAYN